MLPSRSQFRKWTYPSKFAFVSFFLALSLSVAFWLFPDAGKQLIMRVAPSGLEQMLVGTWKGVTTHSSPSGEMVASGYTRLLNTGQYSYSGEVEVRLPSGTAIQFSALAAGTWKATDNGFVLTASDIKTAPRVLKQLGKADVDLTNRLSPIPQALLPRLEDLMPRGTSQEYAIVEVTTTRLRARCSDIRGSIVTHEATRQ
jgi:hypothetical protein